jgi:transcriptional regulator with XRE-family HTH domain
VRGADVDHPERSVKFSVMLEDLLEAPGQAGSRKNLADALGINEASVSHYVRGRAKPSFDALVGMATFFNVSLDYLVFGERPQTAGVDDPAGVRAEIRRALLETADNAGRHLDVVTRISRRLQTEIESAAKALIMDPANFGPVGFVTDAECMAMEACTRRMRIMTRRFQSDVNDGDRGAFFDVMTMNLLQGRGYDYLLYGAKAYWQSQVKVFRDLIREAGVPYEVTHQFLHFRCIDDELTSSVCIHDLDIPLLQRVEPILWERQQKSVSDGDCWAYISVERSDAQGGVVIEPTYLESTLRLFSEDWSRAESI